MPAGRPAFYNSPEELEAKINEYFTSRDEEDYLISELCDYLGFESRQSFFDYGKRPEYSYLIKRAAQKVSIKHERNLSDMKKPTTGAIFYLKTHGWDQSDEASKADDKITFIEKDV
jgi:hypothetical protein